MIHAQASDPQTQKKTTTQRNADYFALIPAHTRFFCLFFNAFFSFFSLFFFDFFCQNFGRKSHMF